MRYTLLIGFITLVLTLVLGGGVQADLAEFEARVAKQLNDAAIRFQHIDTKGFALTSGNDSSQEAAETRAASPAGAQKASKGGSAS